MRIKHMRKVFFVIAAVVLPLCAMAQKTYVNVVALGVNNNYGHTIYLSGDIPSGMQQFYDHYYDKTLVGEILNRLASHGFEVEQMSCTTNEEQMREVIILSKNATSMPTQVREAPTVERNGKGEIKEVARYNLQGMPVQPHEKGVQIVVYSNYTTRTVIVE